MFIIHLKLKRLICPFVLFSTTVVFSQTPADFNFTFKVNYLISPASIDTLGHHHIDFLTNRNGTGLLTNFTSNYVSFNRTYSQIKFKVGLQFFTQKEGDFFRRNKLLANITKGIVINDFGMLKLGVSMGFVNYYFSPSKASAGGSDFALDGNWGISFHTKRLKNDVGTYQFLNSTVTPLDYQFRLKSSYFYRIGYQFLTSKDWRCYLWYLHLIEVSGNNITIAPELYYQDITSFGLGYSSNKGIMFFIGSDRLFIGNLQLNLNLSYYFFDMGGKGTYYSPKEVYLRGSF